jgi:diguanylate cyclase (GGDEF)-like protein/PAS domain S-box-containing protein
MALTSPAQALESYRKSDAVFIICQNNIKKILEIAALNEEASRITGYTNEQMVGHPFSMVLPERISNTINEFIEYGENKNDLSSVLSKVRQFAIKKADGSEMEFRLRIISGESMDRNPWFHVVLINEQKNREADAFRAIIKENFKGHETIDARTGLPDRLSLIKDLELMIYYVRDKNISASFAIVDINFYEELKSEYGEADCYKIHKHVSEIFKSKLRNIDTVGTLSERSLGIILVDASQEEARMVLNRLRWALNMSPLQMKHKELVAQVNISFMQIDGKISNTDLLEKCEAHMKDQRSEHDNSLQLVVARERRAGAGENGGDRRKQNIHVLHDRRKNKEDRRKPPQ